MPDRHGGAERLAMRWVIVGDHAELRLCDKVWGSAGAPGAGLAPQDWVSNTILWSDSNISDFLLDPVIMGHMEGHMG